MCAETIDSARAVWDEVWRTLFSMTRSDSQTSQTRRTFAAVRRELSAPNRDSSLRRIPRPDRSGHSARGTSEAHIARAARRHPGSGACPFPSKDAPSS